MIEVFLYGICVGIGLGAGVTILALRRRHRESLARIESLVDALLKRRRAQ